MRRACALVAGVVVASCGNRSEDAGRAGTVAFGGEILLARRTHYQIDAYGFERPFAGLARWLDGADTSVATLEAVLSDCGVVDPGRTVESFFYRGRPELVRVLTEGNIDVVTLANNHVGDHGPAALVRMLDVLDAAGVGRVGAGRSLREARAPLYRKVGDAVVAFVAVSTVGADSAAGRKRAGIFFHTEAKADELVRTVARLVRAARRQAHVVLLLYHVSQAGPAQPSPSRRTIVRRLIREAKVDAVLADGSHHFRGVEVVDGRPVLHDAGHLLWDGGGGGKRSFLWMLDVDRNGVRAVRARPVELRPGRTVPAGAAAASDVLADLLAKSSKLGARLTIADGEARLALVPQELRAPPKGVFRPHATRTPTFPDPNAQPEAAGGPTDDLELVTPPLAFPNGMELRGRRLAVARTASGRHAIVVSTAWTTSVPVGESVTFHLSVGPPGAQDVHPDIHLPGDWLWPTTRWRPGRTVVDRYSLGANVVLTPGQNDVRLSLRVGSREIPAVSPPDQGPGTLLGRVEIPAAAP